MKRFGMRAAICFAAMIGGTVAHAETTVTVFGTGAFSCGKFIATIGNAAPGKVLVMDNTGSGRFISENSMYQQWLTGFMTGVNVALAGELEQQIKGLDLAGMDLWMRNWCNQHPTKAVFDGANALISEMRTNAGQH
jgi:hypothetical protein